jgi:hypothetical protein
MPETRNPTQNNDNHQSKTDTSKIMKDLGWVKRILTWSIDQDARDSLEEEIFGKRVLVTNHDWPIADVVATYRSQSDAEFGFRQLKDPHTVSFSPMNLFTDQAIRVHTYTYVLALQLAPPDAPSSQPGRPTPVSPRSGRRLGRHRGDRPGLPLLGYSSGGRPKAGKPAGCSPKPPLTRIT